MIESKGRKMVPRHNHSWFLVCLAMAGWFFTAATAQAEDGYRLWLRYDSLPEPMVKVYSPRVTSLVVQGNSASHEAIRQELVNGCTGLLGNSLPVAEKLDGDGAVIVGTPE